MYCYDEDDIITYSVYNNDDPNNPKECILLFYIKDENAMYLQNISKYDNCATNMPNIGGGSLLLQFVIYFVNMRNNKKKI